MKPLRFYEHFACAYGTIWLLMLLMALVLQSHIDAGAFGMFGFPIIALIYAFIRRAMNQPQPGREELLDLQRRIAELKNRSTDRDEPQ